MSSTRSRSDGTVSVTPPEADRTDPVRKCPASIRSSGRRCEVAMTRGARPPKASSIRTIRACASSAQIAHLVEQDRAAPRPRHHRRWGHSIPSRSPARGDDVGQRAPVRKSRWIARRDERFCRCRLPRRSPSTENGRCSSPAPPAGRAPASPRCDSDQRQVLPCCAGMAACVSGRGACAAAATPAFSGPARRWPARFHQVGAGRRVSGR